MFEKPEIPTDKIENYETILTVSPEILGSSPTTVALLANASSVLDMFLTEINWVGFYLLTSPKTLTLGPFQGLPACTEIAFGKGVCGTVASQMKTIRVADVHQFAGHIACDSASNSEIVIPIIVNGKLFGVLDIDSPIKSRFDEIDEKYLTSFVRLLENKLSELN